MYVLNFGVTLAALLIIVILQINVKVIPISDTMWLNFTKMFQRFTNQIANSVLQWARVHWCNLPSEQTMASTLSSELCGLVWILSRRCHYSDTNHLLRLKGLSRNGRHNVLHIPPGKSSVLTLLVLCSLYFIILAWFHLQLNLSWSSMNLMGLAAEY